MQHQGNAMEDVENGRARRVITPDLNCHIAALADWICLIGNRITNREFRSFMLLNDRQVTTRFLARSGLSHEGKGKGSFYVMNEKTNKHESALHEL